MHQRDGWSRSVANSILRTVLRHGDLEDMPLRKEGRKFTHPWQPTRLHGWNSVCLSSA